VAVVEFPCFLDILALFFVVILVCAMCERYYPVFLCCVEICEPLDNLFPSTAESLRRSSPPMDFSLRPPIPPPTPLVGLALQSRAFFASDRARKSSRAFFLRKHLSPYSDAAHNGFFFKFSWRVSELVWAVLWGLSRREGVQAQRFSLFSPFFLCLRPSPRTLSPF